MATGRDNKLTGAIGEYLVAAELCRRGLVAAPFAGNVPHYDVIASDPHGGHLAVQVKTIRSGSWQFDARRFLDIEFDGSRQVLGRAKREPYPKLACVLVLLGNGGQTGTDRFFVLPWRKPRLIVVSGYRRYLGKHGYVRPKAAQSCHTAVNVADVEQFEQKWDLILKRAR